MLFTLFLRQALTHRKWAALLLLTVGVAAKYFSLGGATQLGAAAALFLLLQALLSSFAGVYNESVFKNNAGLSIHQQNFFMYFFAILFNTAIGLFVAPSYYLNNMNVAAAVVGHPIFLGIVVCGAAAGLSAAFILKFINVIVKGFASAVEVLLTAVMAAALLGEALTGRDLLAAAVVMVAVAVYYTKGVGDSRTVRFGIK